MGILEAIEGPEAASSGADADPQVPPDVVETAKADFDRIQQTYDDAFLKSRFSLVRNALASVSEKVVKRTRALGFTRAK